MDKLTVVLDERGAKMPVRTTDFSAGLDLFSCEDRLIEAKDRQLISTGIKIKLPYQTYGRIAPRSGLSIKHYIDIGGGVVDEDYRGVVKVVMINNGKKSFNVEQGMKIAQLIVEKISYVECEKVENLDDTIRGSKGFGSSGKK